MRACDEKIYILYLIYLYIYKFLSYFCNYVVMEFIWKNSHCFSLRKFLKSSTSYFFLFHYKSLFFFGNLDSYIYTLTNTCFLFVFVYTISDSHGSWKATAIAGYFLFFGPGQHSPVMVRFLCIAYIIIYQHKYLKVYIHTQTTG